MGSLSLADGNWFCSELTPIRGYAFGMARKQLADGCRGYVSLRGVGLWIWTIFGMARQRVWWLDQSIREVSALVVSQFQVSFPFGGMFKGELEGTL